MKTLQELHQQRQTALDDAVKLSAEDADWSDETSTKFDGLMAGASALEKRIDQARELERAKAVETVVPILKPGANTPLNQADGVPAPTKLFTIPANAKRYGGNRLTAFTGPDGDVSAYRFGMFLQATLVNDPNAVKFCADHGIKIESAMSSTSNADGGFVIIDEFRRTVIDLVEQYGVFRRNAMSWPMSSDTISAPRVTSGVTVYFVGENTAPTESAPEGDNIALVAKELAALTKIPRTLAADATISLADLVATKMAQAFARKEDDCGFIGDGSSTYGGMVGAEVKINDGTHAASIHVSLTGNTAFSSFDLVDFEAVVGKLPELGYASSEVRWYISKPGFYASMVRLMDAAGGNTKDDIAGGTGLQFLGYPVVISQVLDSNLSADTSAIKCLFGSLEKAAAFGDRAVMTISSDTGGKYFENRQIAILGTERFDINVHDLGDGSTAGPLLALKTASS